MKNMKKLMALLLALVMIFAFAACGSDEAPADDNKGDENKAPVSDVADGDNNSAADKETADFTVKEGKLIMATNAYFQPYEYYEGDKIVGIDAEIAAAIAKKLGLELEIQDMAFDSIITAVNAGSADFGLAGMTVTEDRLKEIDFSISYANGVQVVIVKEGSAIKSVDDLSAGKQKIGVQLGTTGDIYATEDFGDDRVTSYTTGNEAINALLKGDIDCVIIDNEPAKAFVKNNKGLKILDTSYADEDYAACIKKGNKELLDAVNEAIDELVADGTIDAIVAKYIK
ncbi:MAG: transporter substrate-binding domain-containing protein [Clostridia bacterium]|nr:transporter substrate-binding domain-containing protein [Clostridia bacterium]